MKIIGLVLLFLVSATLLTAASLPKDIQGRWQFDEAATVKEWPRRARTDEERTRFAKIVAAFPGVRKKSGKGIAALLDVTDHWIVSREAVLDPQFEVLSVTQNGGTSELKARHYQVPGDDNPKIVLLKLTEREHVLTFELWDDGELQLLYIFKKTA